MRKIMTKEEQSKKNKRNQLLIGGILILLMVLSTAGYSLNGGDSGKNNKIKYNDITFLKDDNGYWQFEFNGNNYITRHNPLEINEIKVSTGVYISNYKNQPLYIVNGSSEPIAEIERNFGIFVQRMSLACLSDNCAENFPIKNCSNDKIIAFREPVEDEKERVYTEENCVFIIANNSNQVKYADAFLFDILNL